MKTFEYEINQHPLEEHPSAVLTVAEACRSLRVSKWTLNKLIRSHQLTSILIGRRRLIPRDAIQALVRRLAQEDFA
jgi:excisionase family DNA binding protein